VLLLESSGEGLSPRRAGFNLRSLHLIFVLYKLALGQVSLPVLQFPLSVLFHQCSTLIFIYMLPLPEGHIGEVWEPSKKQCSFRSHWALNRKVLPRCFRTQIMWEDLVSLLKPTASTSPLLAARFSRLCNLFPVRCSHRSDCTGDGRKSRETLRPSSCEILKRRRGLGIDVLPASPVTLPVPHTVM
jgi:hypothetical protein